MGSILLYVPISPGRHRLGGSAIAQCYSQLGEHSPDLDDPQTLVSCFQVTQKLLRDRLLSAGHDVSDGGLITCLLEMAFAGNCGLDVEFSSPDVSVLDLLFAEELGLVLEVPEAEHERVIEQYRVSGLQCVKIGRAHGRGPTSIVRVCVNGVEVLREEVGDTEGRVGRDQLPTGASTSQSQLCVSGGGGTYPTRRTQVSADL
ncbi:unnamed protein product [Staurois parvus]|uniref:PurM-like C-terminal domain-containing protein n=1 Tax=Staurois parvus TaxID=386267 RepID=A0ABN9DN69_9NEOB|nr:unnamed protein product [Staurois parvus]